MKDGMRDDRRRPPRDDDFMGLFCINLSVRLYTTIAISMVSSLA